VTENLRREARVDAKIKVIVVRGRREVPLETSDVSFKGLFLRTGEPPPIRSLLRLRVSLPLREIEAHAMAVHVATEEDVKEAADEAGSAPTVATTRGAGVGLQFWGLAGPDRVAWDDFVRDLIQKKRAATKKPSGRMQAIKAAAAEAAAATANQSGTRIATSDPESKKSSKR
jgi:hypothetical protein